MKYVKEFWDNKWVLSLTMGILLGLSWPPLPFPFLVFLAFLLLFRIVDLSASAKEAAYRAYPGFVLWNIITTYWLVMATVAGGVAAILANAAVMTIPVILQYHVQKHLKRWWAVALLQSALWVSYEYLHHQWDLAWPWLALGNAWSNVPELVQYISVTGYWGISFWIVLVSALAYQAYQEKCRPAAYTAGILAMLMPAISLIQLGSVAIQSNDKTEVVVAQPNFNSYQQYGGYESAEDAINVLINISDSLRTNQTNLLAWPENGIHPALYSQLVRRNAERTKNSLKNLAASWGLTILGGTTYYEYYPEEEKPPLANYTGQKYYLPYNAALGFYPDSTIQVYRKYNLVPIVERVPYVHTLNALDIFKLVDWRSVQGYGKGQVADQFKVNGTQTPGLVCYDSVFPSWVRKFVKNGAGFLTVITNDGWWGDTSGHTQHFAYARLRALEFRRWVVRSANNGISGVIAPDGSVKLKTNYWERTGFRYQVPVLTHQTFFASYGDWLPYSLLVISLSGIGFVLYRRFNSSE